MDSILILAAAEGADPGLVGQFGINGKIILAQLVNFGVVAFLLWRFAFKPVLATMDERQHTIAEGLRFAEQAKTDLQEAEKRQAEILREANSKAQEILHEAREASRAFEERMKNETTAQIQEMRRRAEDANELERQKMLSEVRGEVARLVVLTSAQVLQRELGAEDRQRLDRAASAALTSSN
jgi:F-type H+-transporting ATPase subunit b